MWDDISEWFVVLPYMCAPELLLVRVVSRMWAARAANFLDWTNPDTWEQCDERYWWINPHTWERCSERYWYRPDPRITRCRVWRFRPTTRAADTTWRYSNRRGMLEFRRGGWDDYRCYHCAKRIPLCQYSEPASDPSDSNHTASESDSVGFSDVTVLSSDLTVLTSNDGEQ